jgi:hypothetical protein
MVAAAQRRVYAPRFYRETLMMQRVTAATSLLAAVAALTMLPDRMPAYAQQPAILVSIEPLPAAVRNGTPFQVATVVRNTSGVDQSLRFWSCSFPEQWIADNPVVSIPDVPCLKNSAMWVTLKPGRAYTEQLAIQIDLPAGGRSRTPVEFRLGFKPLDPQGAAIPALIWGNPVEVDVLG